MRCRPLGDAALLIELGVDFDEATHARVRSACEWLEETRLVGVTEFVPGYTSVTLFFEPAVLVRAGASRENPGAWLAQQVESRLSEHVFGARPAEGPCHEIPVCYASDFAPDLPEVARHSGLDESEVVRRHSSATYRVAVVGFAPGFAYLTGLPPELAAPRKATPRPRVEAGAVGIAGHQTGVYPLPTPGGWQIIGRTPLRLFLPDQDPPVRLRMGDRVRFRPMEREDYAQALQAGREGPP